MERRRSETGRGQTQMNSSCLICSSALTETWQSCRGRRSRQALRVLTCDVFCFFLSVEPLSVATIAFFLLYFSVKAEKWNILKKQAESCWPDPFCWSALSWHAKKCRNSDPQLLIYQDGVCLLGQDCFLNRKKILPSRPVQTRSLPLWFLCPADWNRHPDLFSQRFRDYICSIISWVIWSCHPWCRQTSAKQALAITKVTDFLSFCLHKVRTLRRKHTHKKYVLRDRKLLGNSQIHKLRLFVDFIYF